MTTDPDALMTVTMAASEFEANTLVAVLREAGIEAMTFDGGSRALGLSLAGGANAVPVQVRAADLQRAREALQSNIADSIDLDWDDVDVGQREELWPSGGPGRLTVPIKLGLRLLMIVIVAMLLGALVLTLRVFR